MRTIKVNQIKTVLDECLKLSSGKVYSVLFVSELDDFVRDMIKEWVEEQKEKGSTYSFRGPAFLYNENAQGFLEKTNDYCYFDQANIVFDNIELGYGGDEAYKNAYTNAYLNLKNKKGECHNKVIQLIILRTLNPAWVNNRPLFGVNDASLFDEIINIEPDKEVFKEIYLGAAKNRIKRLEERIKNNDSSDDIEELKGYLSEIKSRYDLTKFVLDHPSFEFVPLVRLEGVYDSITGTATAGFSPVDFCNIFQAWEWEDWESDIRDHCSHEKTREILIEIIKEYQMKKH